jgi:hypothetical protein
MKNKDLRVVVYILITMVLLLNGTTQSKGCTIFSISDSTKSILGNTEDTVEEGFMTISPSKPDSYGRITFSFADKYVQGGINEYGLAADGTGAKEMQIVLDPTKPNLSDNVNIIDLMLKKCKTVDEVIPLCSQYNLTVLKWAHIMVADGSGKSVVIEIGKNGYTEFLIKDGNYQLLTNFNLSNPTIGYYPCWRYDAAIKLLPNVKTEIWDAASVLKAVNQGGGIQYGHVYDCTNKKFHLFRNDDYNQALVFDVEKLIKKGEDRLKMNDLPKLKEFSFPADSLFGNSEKIDISFRSVVGDYKIYVSKSTDMKNSISFPLVMKDISKVAFCFIPFLFLFLYPIKRRKQSGGLAMIFLFVILFSCNKDDDKSLRNNNLMPYETQIDGIDSGDWYWMVKGTTENGYQIETKPMKFTMN